MTQAEIKTILKSFIRTELLGDPEYPLGDDERMITDGLLDSYAVAYIAVFIESRFGVVIPDDELTAENFDSLEQIAERVVRGMAT